MTPETICELLKDKFEKAVVDTVLGGGHPYAVINASDWPDVARFLCDDPRLRFNMLRSISALDLLAENR